ncbi:hypothetical protein C1646_773412 [Rhizophagus diaphanus]|nr:hypothetical protein C1646_773412 [Rhizophagus diaphanus] [Rhizophagus sp. MUCL 43196]
MVKTNYFDLNPVVVQALNNLQYRYSGKTPEMWYSRVHYLFKKLLENNPNHFSKNGFIQMIERSYKNGGFKAERRSFHIYVLCSKSIQKNTKKGGARVSSLSSNEVDVIFMNYSEYSPHGYHIYNTDYEFRERIAYFLFNNAKIIQRAFKLRPETWAKQVWNMENNPQTQEEYDLHIDKYVNCLKKAYNENITQKYIKKYLAEWVTGYKEYDYYHPSIWVEMKKYQLYNRLNTVAYIVTFIKLRQQGYKIITYEDWSLMLKCLVNPEYHRISKVNNNIVVVKSSEYARYTIFL